MTSTSQQVVLSDVWVQCCNEECMKWRKLHDNHDPCSVPEHWICANNNALSKNTCVSEEEDWPPEDNPLYKRYVTAEFAPGSLVIVRLNNSKTWWPGVVDYDPGIKLFLSLMPAELEVVRQYHVVLLGWKLAWVAASYVEKFVPQEWETQGVTHWKVQKGTEKIIRNLPQLKAFQKAIEVEKLDLTDRLLKHGVLSLKYLQKPVEKQDTSGLNLPTLPPMPPRKPLSGQPLATVQNLPSTSINVTSPPQKVPKIRPRGKGRPRKGGQKMSPGAAEAIALVRKMEMFEAVSQSVRAQVAPADSMNHTITSVLAGLPTPDPLDDTIEAVVAGAGQVPDEGDVGQGGRKPAKAPRTTGKPEVPKKRSPAKVPKSSGKGSSTKKAPAAPAAAPVSATGTLKKVPQKPAKKCDPEKAVGGGSETVSGGSHGSAVGPTMNEPVLMPGSTEQGYDGVEKAGSGLQVPAEGAPPADPSPNKGSRQVTGGGTVVATGTGSVGAKDATTSEQAGATESTEKGSRSGLEKLLPEEDANPDPAMGSQFDPTSDDFLLVNSLPRWFGRPALSQSQSQHRWGGSQSSTQNTVRSQPMSQNRWGGSQPSTQYLSQPLSQTRAEQIRDMDSQEILSQVALELALESQPGGILDDSEILGVDIGDMVSDAGPDAAEAGLWSSDTDSRDTGVRSRATPTSEVGAASGQPSTPKGEPITPQPSPHRLMTNSDVREFLADIGTIKTPGSRSRTATPAASPAAAPVRSRSATPATPTKRAPATPLPSPGRRMTDRDVSEFLSGIIRIDTPGVRRRSRSATPNRSPGGSSSNHGAASVSDQRTPRVSPAPGATASGSSFHHIGTGRPPATPHSAFDFNELVSSVPSSSVAPGAAMASGRVPCYTPAGRSTAILGAAQSRPAPASAVVGADHTGSQNGAASMRSQGQSQKKTVVPRFKPSFAKK